jgi:WD40 repeat protein
MSSSRHFTQFPLILLATIVALISTTASAQAPKLRAELKPEDIEGEPLAFTPDGKLLVVASNEGIEVWHIAAGKHDQIVIDIGVDAIALQPDGRRGVAANGATTEVKWFDVAGHRVTKTWASPVEGIREAVFSPSGKTLALDLSGNKVSLCEVPAGKPGKTIEYASSSAAISGIAFSPDGKLLATGGSEKSLVRLWNPETGQLVREFMGEGAYLSSARFSGDGKRLVTGHGDFSARLWDPATGQLKATFPATDKEISASGFLADVSPDARFVATLGYHGPAKIWDAAGKELAKLPGKQADAESRCVAFSPDGKLLAVGFKKPFGPSDQPTVMLWELPQSGQ